MSTVVETCTIESKTNLVNKHYKNEVTLREQNLLLKCCKPLEMLIYFEEGFRSFHTFNIGSIGQRAAKLLAVKVGGLKKKFAAGLSQTKFRRLGPNDSQV